MTLSGLDEGKLSGVTHGGGTYIRVRRVFVGFRNKSHLSRREAFLCFVVDYPSQQ